MNKLYQLLGLAMRAGKVVSGETAVIERIRSSQIHVVLIAQDASTNTFKKVTDKCTYYETPWQTVSSRGELGAAIGKDERVVVGVTDPGFARKIIQYSEGA
jgi:ribosomal protein L7Ae-like RNA K-turn-binding protein